MARMPDLVPFAQRHGLKIGTIEDLIAYRFKNDNLVNMIAQRAVESAHGGAFELRVYVTTVEPGEHLAMIKGDLSAPGPVLVRVHAVKPLSDLLGIKDQIDRSAAIKRSLEAISREGRGVLVLVRDLRLKAIMDALGLDTPGSISRKPIQGRRMVEVGIGSQILRHLGVREMVLLTNSPASVYVGLEGFGLKVVGTRRFE
jgi:3,4-dihydroxy 2-butanone 4-phosphate synthase/GTP cyclohydrolase II